MMPRTVNCFSPSTVPSGRPAADRELVPVGELLRQDERVGLREEDQRIVDRPPRRRSRGRSRAGCGRRSCRRRAPAGCPGPGCSSRRPPRSPARRRARVGADCTVSSTSSSKPVSPAVTCSSVLPAMRSTVCENANSTLWLAVCMPTNTATPSTMPGRRQHRPQHVLAEVRPADQPQQDHATQVAEIVLDDPAVAQRDGALAALRDRSCRA